MSRRQAAAVFVAFVTLLATSACAGDRSPLRLADGSAGVCVNFEADQPELYWFGIPIENVTDRAIVLEQVTLDDSELALAAAFVVPPVRSSDGGALGLGADWNPALHNPELWAGRRQLRGFVLAAHASTEISLGLSRAPGVQDARNRAQRVRFHYDGDSTPRASVSVYEIRIAPQCG